MEIVVINNNFTNKLKLGYKIQVIVDFTKNSDWTHITVSRSNINIKYCKSIQLHIYKYFCTIILETVGF